MLYTIKHGKNMTSTAETYQQYLGIVNKETLLALAETMGMTGVAKTHAKEKMVKAIQAYVMEHPENILAKLSFKELQVLKEFTDKGPNTPVIRPSRRFYDTLESLLLVSVYHSTKERRFYFLLPDELRELFAPFLDKQIKEAKKREKAEKESNPKKPAIKIEEPEYLNDNDELLDSDFDDEWDDDDKGDFKEEIVGIGHRHYDNFYDFFNSIPQHDTFDSVLAVQDFYQNTNVVESKNAAVTLYATVVYANQRTEKILFRSTEPLEVRIDTKEMNSITIEGLPSTCVSRFSTDTEEMNYSYGVLTIEGHDKTGEPYIVSLI